MRLASDYGSRAWCLPPPIDGEWTNLKAEDAALLTARLSEASQAKVVGLSVEAIRVVELGFYPGWMLCDIQTTFHEQPPKSDLGTEPSREALVRNIQSFLYGPDGFTLLSGLSDVIHEHNRRHGIVLEVDKHRRDYLRFFSYFVRGSDGPFEIQEDQSRLDTTQMIMADASREPINVLEPVRAVQSNNTGNETFEYRAHLLYGNDLFEGHFSLGKAGTVDMLQDDHIAKNVQRAQPVGFFANARFPLDSLDASGGGAP